LSAVPVLDTGAPAVRVIENRVVSGGTPPRPVFTESAGTREPSASIGTATPGTIVTMP
jgi:hypothetical protein